jgi:hypothetical protein
VITEAQLHHLYTQLTHLLGTEGANTMIDIVSPFARSELATKADLAELRAEFRADLAELKHDVSRTVAGWLFVSQGVLVAIVGLLVSLR